MTRHDPPDSDSPDPRARSATPAPGPNARLRAAWPHLRAALIGCHVLAVIALCLPSPSRIANRAMWNSRNTQAEFDRWAKNLDWLGYRDAAELEADLWGLARGYVRIRNRVVVPFVRYAELVGGHQGWAMFATPQKHPAELHIDVRAGEAWRPVYRPHSTEHAFWADAFRHNRFRKLLGRYARSARPQRYHAMARFVAERAAVAYPDSVEVRVRLYRYAVLLPAEVRAGRRPRGTYASERRFAAAELRAAAGPVDEERSP